MNQLKTILLVEDDQITIYLNIHIITRLNICKRLEIRNNGKEALEYILDCDKIGMPRPELILLDLHMPYMSGREFLEEYEKIRNNNIYQSEIVILTATHHPQNLTLCKRHKIGRLVNKPLTFDLMKHLASPYIHQVEKSII